jgi:hypothetical protein
MVVETDEYNTDKSPRSWAKVIAMRHALSKYPDATYIWFLDQNAYIMELDRTLEEQVMNPAKLEELMIKDWSIVPPDSIIKTFSHLRGQDANLIISQDEVGLVTNSYVLKNGDWAKFFVETWMDPLYQAYNFQKAERHALVSSQMILAAIREHKSNFSAGTYRPMAPYDSLKTRSCAAAHVCLIRPQQQGRQCVPRRRPCHAHDRLHDHRSNVLRQVVACLPAAVEKQVWRCQCDVRRDNEYTGMALERGYLGVL